MGFSLVYYLIFPFLVYSRELFGVLPGREKFFQYYPGSMIGQLHWERRENKIVPWWKCEKVYDCSNADLVIQRIPLLAAALKYGCFCRGLKNILNLTCTFTVRRGTLFSCRKSTIRSPGHLVWALSDGTWTTAFTIRW